MIGHAFPHFGAGPPRALQNSSGEWVLPEAAVGGGSMSGYGFEAAGAIAQTHLPINVAMAMQSAAACPGLMGKRQLRAAPQVAAG